MRWRVVMFYGDGANDYGERWFDDKGDANFFLMALGYGYSTTHGREDVFYNEDGHIASISPNGD
jgi:hypothetical protein